MYAHIEFLEKFIDFSENAFQIIFDREDIKDEIIRLNTEKQLSEQGVLSTGELVSPDGYADSTIVIRQQEGLQVRFMDLKFTGEFHMSWKVKVTKTKSQKSIRI